MDARRRQIAKRNSTTPLPKVKPYENYKVRIKNIEGKISKHTDPTLINSHDPKHAELNSAVMEFLAKGGEILKFPDEINGRTPSVNFSFGFELDSSRGFGMELNATQLLEEYDRNPYVSPV